MIFWSGLTSAVGQLVSDEEKHKYARSSKNHQPANSCPKNQQWHEVLKTIDKYQQMELFVASLNVWLVMLTTLALMYWSAESGHCLEVSRKGLGMNESRGGRLDLRGLPSMGGC